MNLRRRPLVMATATGALAAGCATDMTAPPRESDEAQARLQRAMTELVEDPDSPWLGAAALVVRDGQMALQAHVGWQRLDPALPGGGVRTHGRTMFRMASVSKMVVAVGVMRLVEQGRLNLDEDVSAWLGWRLRHPQYPARPLTLRALMSHRAGLSDAAGYAFGASVALRDVLEEGRPRFGRGGAWRKGREPGTSFAYCNLAWGVIGTVMEAATGERFDRLMQQLVLGPLGLRGGFDPSAWSQADRDDLATLYRKRREEGGREIWDPAGPWVVQADDPATVRKGPPGLASYVPGTNGAVFGPQGSLRTSLADLGVLMQVMLAGGVHRGERFLAEDTVRALASEQWRAGTPGAGDENSGRAFVSWGLGVQRFTDTSAPGRGDRLVEGGGLVGWGHLGDAYGVLSTFVLDPVRRHGVVAVLHGPTHEPFAAPGRWSSLARAEERLLTAAWQHGLRGGTGA